MTAEPLSTGRTIVKNFFSLSMADAASKLVAFLVTPYLARLLGADGFGEISFAQALLAYLLLIGNFGLSTIGTREIAKQKERTGEYVGSIVILRMILSVVSFGLLSLLASFIGKSSEVQYLILLYGLSIFPTAMLLEWAFSGLEAMEYIAISRVLGSLVYAGLVLLLIRHSGQILSVPLFYFMSTMAAVLFMALVFLKRYGHFHLKMDLSLWNYFARQAWPIGISLLMIQLYQNFDTVMLGVMFESEVVGWYNAAYKLIIVIVSLRGTAVSALFPVVAKLWAAGDMGRLNRLVGLATKLGVALAVPMGVGGTILAPQIIGSIYTDAYANSVIAFQILIWTASLLLVNLVFPSMFNACGRQDLYFKGHLVVAFLNIGLNAMLIPRYSLVGAATVTVVCDTFSLIFFYSAARRALNVELSLVGLIPRPLIATTAMAGLIWLLSYSGTPSVFPLVAAGALTYIVVLVLIGGLAPSELRMVKAMLSRGEE